MDLRKKWHNDPNQIVSRFSPMHSGATFPLPRFPPLQFRPCRLFHSRVFSRPYKIAVWCWPFVCPYYGPSSSRLHCALHPICSSISYISNVISTKKSILKVKFDKRSFSVACVKVEILIRQLALRTGDTKYTKLLLTQERKITESSSFSNVPQDTCIGKKEKREKNIT